MKQDKYDELLYEEPNGFIGLTWNKELNVYMMHLDCDAWSKTEDGFTATGSGTSASFVLNNQSSCRVQAQWNWANSLNSGRWGLEFQAYRLLRMYIPTGAADKFDTGEAVVVTKNKLRGSGKTLSLKIQSEEGKDMKLLGWSVQAVALTKA